MKIKKSELEALIENFLFEDKTSDAFQSINVAGRNTPAATDAISKGLADLGFKATLVKGLASFLGMSEASLLNAMVFIFKRDILPMETRQLLMKGLKKTYDGSQSVVRKLITNPQSTFPEFVAIASISLGTLAFYSILPLAFAKSIEDSAKIQNSLKKLKELQEYRYRKSNGTAGIKEDEGLKLEDLNDGAITRLVGLFMKDTRSANQIINSLLDDNIIDAEVVGKVMTVYNQYREDDYLLRPNDTVFTDESLNEAFFVLKFLLIVGMAGTPVPVNDTVGIDSVVIDGAGYAQTAGKQIRSHEDEIKEVLPNYKKHVREFVSDIQSTAGTGMIGLKK